MDLVGLEIYIPVEAEVKNIPLWSLPNSVLRRMGLPLPASEGSKAPADPPEAIWICPTVIRRRSQNAASHTGNGVKENISSLLYREFRATQGPLRMSFVSPNCTAYTFLQDIMPGKNVPPCHTSLVPHGSALKKHQDAVVIYHGRIYLIIRNPKRNRSQQETCDPQPVTPSSLHSTSAVSADNQEKELLNDNKPNNKDARRKRPARFQTQGDQEEVANNESDECEMQERDSQEAESTDQNNAMDSNTQTDDRYQNGKDNWTRRDPPSAAAGTSPQQTFDFLELERKEKIARLKAKLRQAETELHNKHLSK